MKIVIALLNDKKTFKTIVGDGKGKTRQVYLNS